MMKNLLLIMLLIAAVLLTGCMSEEEEAFQGTWYYMSEHLAPIVGETDLEVIWFFKEGYFELQACCFNQDEFLTGYYKITEQEGNEISLELMEIRNHGVPVTGSMIAHIEILDNPELLIINWAGPFERMASK